jgi:hypothetical protein
VVTEGKIEFWEGGFEIGLRVKTMGEESERDGVVLWGKMK